MSVAAKEKLTAGNAEDFAADAKKGNLFCAFLSESLVEKNLFCAPPREPLRPLRLKIFALLSFAILTACQSASSNSQPISVGALCDEYQRSRAAARNKYDGKEITVRGYAATAAKTSRDDNDQPSISLEEKEREPTRRVVCWFSKEQATEFAKVRANQFITVKGVFNGEAGADLKFCKLFKVE